MKETTEITLNKSQLPSWLATFSATQKPQHIIITLPEEDLKPLASFAKQYSQQQAKSVVVVQRALALEDFELSLHIAPTLQEAYDLIELDEIERDLWK